MLGEMGELEENHLRAQRNELAALLRFAQNFVHAVSNNGPSCICSHCMRVVDAFTRLQEPARVWCSASLCPENVVRELTTEKTGHVYRACKEHLWRLAGWVEVD